MADDIDVQNNNEESLTHSDENIAAESHTDNLETQNSGNNESAQPHEDGNSSENNEEPFNKNPKFKERLKQVEEKYGTWARYWEGVQKASQEDPEYALLTIKKLESIGQIQAGAYEAAKADFEKRGLLKTEEATKSDAKKESSTGSNPEELKKVLNSLPEFQRLQEWEKQRAEEVYKRNQEKENWLVSFEKDRPEIAGAENAPLVRSTIAANANFLMAQDKTLSWESAMDRAYRTLFKGEEVIKQARESGELNGALQQQLESSVNPTGGQAVKSSTRSLTPEEEEARKLIGVTKEEYIYFLEQANK